MTSPQNITETITNTDNSTTSDVLTEISDQHISTFDKDVLSHEQDVEGNNLDSKPQICEPKIYLRPKLNFPLIICVECTPGTDKSYFVNEFIVPVLKENAMQIIFVNEPSTNCINIRELALTDPKRWLFEYQIMVLKDKMRLYKKAFDLVRESDVEVLFLDSSLIADDIFAQTNMEMGLLTNNEYQDLVSWHQLCYEFFPIKPHILFFLKTDVNHIGARLGESQRSFSESRRFFETLEIMYSVTFKTMSKNPDIEPTIVQINNIEKVKDDEHIKNEILTQTKNAIINHKRMEGRVLERLNPKKLVMPLEEPVSSSTKLIIEKEQSKCENNFVVDEDVLPLGQNIFISTELNKQI
jgi:deoxyadenosine/deoxycytidine kinase